jgi:hypothetical protein
MWWLIGAARNSGTNLGERYYQPNWLIAAGITAYTTDFTTGLAPPRKEGQSEFSQTPPQN